MYFKSRVGHRLREMERNKEISFIHYPNGFSSQSWSRMKSLARNSIHVSHMNEGAESHFLLLSWVH